MPDVRMPDGTIIKNVPEGITKSQLQARLAKKTDAYNESKLSQGLSGVNEGIASTFGMPVDIVNAGLRFIGAPTSDKPIMGSGWIADKLAKVGAIGAESPDPWNKFTRRVGQSVGAASVPIAGTVGPSAKALKAFVPAITGGTGAAMARDLAPNNPLAEVAGELVGSALGGGFSYARAKKAANIKVRENVPTIPDLKQKASDLYAAAEQNGVKANPTQTQDLASQLRTIAQDEGLISPTGRVSEAYPKAKEAMQLADDYAKGDMTPKQMQTVRKVLRDAASNNDPAEQRIATKMLTAFDDWTAPLSPELAQARTVARRYINAGKLERARELAGARASQFSGSGFENALRTEYRNLDRQIIKGNERGFTPETIAQIEKVSRGTPLSNGARAVGKLAPTGVVSMGLGSGVPFAIGNTVGGPVAGATFAAGTPLVGYLGRRAATNMGINFADMAELTARNGGNLPEASVFDPSVMRLIAAQVAGQSSPYLNREQVKRKRKQ